MMEIGDEIRYLYDHYLVGSASGCVSRLGREEVVAEYGIDDSYIWAPTKHHLLRIGQGSVHLMGHGPAVQER